MMKVFEANITHQVSGFLIDNLKDVASYKIANEKIRELCGLLQFFDSDQELKTIKEAIELNCYNFEEPDRAEYGDFQTNQELANGTMVYLGSKKIFPEVIIEPTCGKGNFIIASLRHLLNVKYIVGVEIYKPYVWETKFNIIGFTIENPRSSWPEISIAHCSVFNFNFKQVADQYLGKEVLVIGNPPWVTNSKLGSLDSTNLPKKTNFKNHSGLDAMTGKGNFDIAEFITLTMINTFQKMKGNLLFLVKNSVIKNIVFDQYKNNYLISELEKLCIDSKMEFNVSVEASLFYCKLNSVPSFNCLEFDFYKNESHYLRFGWSGDKFVSNIEKYTYIKEIDGLCPFVWRQGLKHDCSTIMELDKVNGHYVNGLNREVVLENDLVYGILKSSDLKNTVINLVRKFTIVTQKRVGQETRYIKSEFPKTYKYLSDHVSNFEARKSSIYEKKPLFSIFGIGDYSFKLYKVAISGLYKTFHFTLVLPQDNKPVMLDDTCYLIGFDRLEYSVYALILLNSNESMRFLQSITFVDAKRTFTKDVLMRIDLLTLANRIDKQVLEAEMGRLNKMYDMNLTLDLWDDFINEMKPIGSGQMAMFV